MLAEGVTDLERAVAVAMTSPLGVGGARFHTGGQPGPADTVYLGVFRREWLDAAAATTRGSPVPRTGSSTTASARRAESSGSTPRSP